MYKLIRRKSPFRIGLAGYIKEMYTYCNFLGGVIPDETGNLCTLAINTSFNSSTGNKGFFPFVG